MGNTDVIRDGYVINDEELRQIQLIHLEMIIELDRICKKSGIKYCLVGGTALGAARHGGCIPWDDDADIGFLRSEYEKFRNACEAELDKSKFYFQDHRNTKGYRWGYGKLRRKNTEFVRLNQEHMPYEQGIFIDIMPFDYVPENYFVRSIHNFICFSFRKIFWSYIGKNTATGIEKTIYELLSLIPENAVYSTFNRFIKYNHKHESDIVRILTFPAANSYYGYKIKWYTDLIDIDYEGHKFPIAKQYKKYLKFKYGDYMTLPPIEKRKVHPVSKLKLLDNNEEC